MTVHQLPDMASSAGDSPYRKRRGFRIRAFEARFMAEADEERAMDLLATKEGEWFLIEGLHYYASKPATLRAVQCMGKVIPKGAVFALLGLTPEGA